MINISSYYALRNKGLFARMPKYKSKEELFTIQFAHNSFKLIESNNIIQLTVGKHISNNYIDIANDNNYVCVNPNSDVCYKYYCKKEHFMIRNKNTAVSKKLNYIIKLNRNVYYIPKNDKNIINGYYNCFNIPKNKIKGKIKIIEIVPLYNGKYFKINISHEIDNFHTTNHLSKESKIELNINDAKKIIKVNTPPIIINPKKVKQITIDDMLIQKPPIAKKTISIDLGMVNLMTIYDPSDRQYIIKGNHINSINKYYNGLIDAHRSILHTLTKNPTYSEHNEKSYGIKQDIEKIKSVTINNFMENKHIYDNIIKYPKRTIYDGINIINTYYNTKKIFKYHKKSILGLNNNDFIDILEKKYYSLLKKKK